MLNRTCRQCGATFQGARQQVWCSEICMLEGRTNKVGDCWIWPRSPNSASLQYTWQGAHQGVMRLLSRLTGKPLFERSQMDPTCGNSLCVNPAHFRVKPAPCGNPAGGRGKFTDEDVLYAARSTCSAVEAAEKIGCSVGLVRAVRKGRLHSGLTGIQPKARP